MELPDPSLYTESFAGFLAGLTMKDEPCPEYHKGRYVVASIVDASGFGCNFKFFWLFPEEAKTPEERHKAFAEFSSQFTDDEAFVLSRQAQQYLVHGDFVTQGILCGFARSIGGSQVQEFRKTVNYGVYYQQQKEMAKKAKENKEAMASAPSFLEEYESRRLEEELFKEIRDMTGEDVFNDGV